MNPLLLSGCFFRSAHERINTASKKATNMKNKMGEIEIEMKKEIVSSVVLEVPLVVEFIVFEQFFLILMDVALQ